MGFAPGAAGRRLGSGVVALRAPERNGGALTLSANEPLERRGTVAARRRKGRLAPKMSGEMEFYLAAVPAVILLGLSKGGFSGLSTLAMPMMSLVISPVRAAAIVLPVLVVQDWVSVWAFRRDFSPRNLLILIPSSMIGIAAGWLLAARVSEDAVRLAVGVISIAFVFYMLIRDRLGLAPVATAGRAGRPPVGLARRVHELHQLMPGRRRSRSM